MNKKTRIIGIIVMAAAVVFLVQRFLSLGVDFAELFSAGKIPALLFVTVCICGTFFVSSCGWVILLSFFANKKAPMVATYSVYVRSNIAKYIPGNVGHYVMRQLYGTSLGIRQRELLLSSVLEICCIASTALILSFLIARSVVVQVIEDALHRAWLVPILAVVIGVCVIGVIYFMRKKGFSFADATAYFKRKGFPRSIISVLGLSACNLLIYGTTLLFLFDSGNAWGQNSLLIISAGIVSWFVGFATPGVPGGIGVREAVLLLMLSPVMPDSLVLYAVVMQRLAFVFADIISWAIGSLIERKTKTRKSV